MWSVLLVFTCASDVSTWKESSICYARTASEVSSCRELAGRYSEVWWGLEWDRVKDTIGNFIWVTNETAEQALAEANGYVVNIYAFADMSGGDDSFDLNQIKDRKIVNVWTSLPDTREYTTNLNKLAKSQVKAITKLKARVAGKPLADDTDVRREMIGILERKRQKHMGKFLGNKTQVAPKTKSGIDGCYIWASGDVYSKVDALVLNTHNVRFGSRVQVPYAYMKFTEEYPENANYLNADYLLTTIGAVETPTFRTMTIKDLAIVMWWTKEVVFRAYRWTIKYGANEDWTESVELSYNMVPGRLSVLVETDPISATRPHNVNLTAADDSYVRYPVGGLNLSLFCSYCDGADLHVWFDADWDSRVSNTPNMTFEVLDNSSVEVFRRPTQASIKTASIADRVGAPGPPPPTPEPNDTNVGLIVGIVIAVIAVVVIVVVVVVCVMKSKKGKVHPEETDPKQETESEAPQEPPSQPKEQPPPQPNQQPPPPPPYPYQQPPPSQPYQQPLPPYPYQQAPPPYAYQQGVPAMYGYPQPQEPKKHKHKKDKHKQKKDKHNE